MSRFARTRIPIASLAIAVLFACALSATNFRSHTTLSAVSNGRIAYSAEDDQNNTQIYTANIDDSNIQQLTSGDNTYYMPVWSPDGVQIAYESNAFDDDTSQIFVMNADGSNKIDVTNDDSTNNGTPAWSPDGNTFAYSSAPTSFATHYAITTMNTDGTGKHTLTDGSQDCEFPTWSPDGTQLAFICEDNLFAEQVWTMNADGTNQQQITSGNTTDYTSVAWSPDGTTLAYSTISHGGGYIEHLGTMNPDGSNRQTITTTYTGVGDVGWSPDGSKLIYDNYDTVASTERIYYIHLDGSGETAITPDDKYAILPSWQPITVADNDGDGVSNLVEALGPHGGDSNGDSIPDRNQANVTSLVDPVTAKYMSLQTSCTTNTTVSVEAAPTDYTDAAFHYPAGLIGFTLDCGAPGSTASVNQYYYGVTFDSSMLLRKYDASSHAYATIPGSTVTATTIGGQAVTKVSYQIKDGGPFDQDGLANGTIVDPVGLAVPVVGTPNTGFGTARLFSRLLAPPSL